MDQDEQTAQSLRNTTHSSVSSDVGEDMEIVSENDPLLGRLGYRSYNGGYNKSPIGAIPDFYSDENSNSSSQACYERRRRVNQASNYVYPDHGTYLGYKIPGREDLPPMDNPITVALNKCQNLVLRPYLRLLLSVGLQPFFDEPETWWHKAINIIHPISIVLLLFIGYIIQYSAACFRRDRAGEGFNEPWLPMPPSNISNGSLVPAKEICEYLIPDILHSVAYAYSFYMYRITHREQIPVLMEKVFLQTSATQSGFLSQGKLIRNLRIMFYSSLGWVILSQIAQIIHVSSAYPDMNFYWLQPSTEFGRFVLIVVMCLGFVMLDIVYMTVVISYCVQCFLLIFYVEGLQQKVRTREYSLQRAMKETFEVQGHIKFLNQQPGTALSIVMVNFGTMAILGTLALVNPQDDMFTPLMYAATGMAVILWFSIMILPLIQAARLSAACNSMRKLGHEIKVRPFGWQDEKEEELDSFLIFQSSLSMKAKIFLIPVRSSFLCGLVVAVGVLFVLLFQTGVLSVWL